MKLEIRGVTKRFGSLVANDHIDLTVDEGQIHCLLGENGAGKSTLMNVLFGLLQPDDGQILIDDQPVVCHSPADAMAAGIGMVHQHFMLVPVFTVAENVMLGAESTKRFGLLDTATAARRVREISEKFGFDVDPGAIVEHLPVGVQQRVEIIKALVRDARVLILDEPTAVLTPQETDELIEIMRQLKAGGTSIVFITHKLREVKAIADRITVLRRGKVVGEADPSMSESELASMMVGRSVTLAVDKEPASPGDASVQVSGLTVVDERDHVVVDDVSFDVHAGEILAVAGVQGNGQTELAEAILGLQDRTKGSIKLDGHELVGKSTKAVLHAGVGFVPEDRKVDGVVGEFSVAENLMLDLYDRKPFSAGPSIKPSAVKANGAARIQEFDIRTESGATQVKTLSGGNQQKVVIAREMSRELRLLIVAQPTRGLDVGSIEFVHKRIVAERDKGTAVIVVSTELDEVSALADRVLVMYRGKVVGIVPGDTGRDVLGLMMAGVPPREADAQAAENPTLLEAHADGSTKDSGEGDE